MRANTTNRRRAFTLVELLVVIGIIALLIGILMPALGRARESSRTVKCLANLRGIMQGAHLYTAENKGFILPCGNDATGQWWCNILVDYGYVTAPDSTGTAPAPEGIFYCPGGNMEFFPPNLANNDKIPDSRIDERTCMPSRHKSTMTGKQVDCWYGMNASEGSNMSKGPPCRRLETVIAGQHMPSNIVRRPSEMVMFFDGLYYHQTSVNGNRISARHANKTRTNIAFFDGHADTFITKSLPGGMGVGSSAETQAAFNIANLRANFPPPAHPMWLLDQQY